MRKKGLNRHTITATPRQLESLIRMSEAFAKMRLSPDVTEDDVDEAISLMNLATLKSATDPETGLIDMDIITTGKTELLKHKSFQLSQKIKQIL
jgi:DNA replication licensing factor MCM4